MKHFKLRNMVAVCLAVAILGGALTVFSLATGNQPTVTYDHEQKGFIFENVAKMEGNEYPNLFTDFQNMMPGDAETQDIRVQVENVDKGTVYMYLRTELTWEDNLDEITDAEAEGYQDITDYEIQMEEALKQVKLVVSQEGKELTEASLAEGVLLGKFRNDDKTDLQVTLEIPLEAGNELANLYGEIGWVFTAEYHKDPITPVGPVLPELNAADHFAYIIGYPDGLVHPELQITRAESTTIFFRMLLEEFREDFWSQVNPYYDVLPDDWYNNAISTMTNAGIVNGYPDGNFYPNDNITRAEFATMAVRFFAGDDEEITEDAFPDIADHWANYEINLAYAKEIIEGYPDGTFKPDQEITRAEAMTIVNRVLERHPHEDHLLEDMIVWPDNMDKDMWYYEAVQEATNSHAYTRDYDNEAKPYEIWTELLPVRDWAALEQMWSEYNSSPNPGEVVSSKRAAIFE